MPRHLDSLALPAGRILLCVPPVLLAGLVACRPAPPSGLGPAASASALAAASAAASVASAAPAASSARVPVVVLAPMTTASGSAQPVASGPAVPRGSLQLDPKTLDLATGSYVALGALGAVIRRRDDELLIVRLGGDAKLPSLPEDGKVFARTRTILIDHAQGSVAYWASEGKLLRRALDGEGKSGPIETIADDVEDGYPPHGVRNEGSSAVAQDLVAYVARPRSRDGERRARVWIEGKGLHDLSPDDSGGTSVWLTSLGPGRVGAVWLDARSALAPVHAMPIDLDGAGEPRFGKEGIAWMAPPSELLLNVAALRTDGGLVALLPVPKNGMDFGLAAVPVTFGAAPVTEPVWFDYPNGLDPAPVVPVRFCGLSAAAIVRPTARPAESPKSLDIVTVEASGKITPRAEIAQARRIDHVTAWASPKGDGWVAWVGDGRTRLRHVKCGK